MSEFTFHILHGTMLYEETGGTMTASADTVAEAAGRAGIDGIDLKFIVAFTKDGVRKEVAGQTNCGCVYHAEDGMACDHDLERAELPASDEKDILTRLTQNDETFHGHVDADLHVQHPRSGH